MAVDGVEGLYAAHTPELDGFVPFEYDWGAFLAALAAGGFIDSVQ
jgi:hypothetical protein